MAVHRKQKYKRIQYDYNKNAAQCYGRGESYNLDLDPLSLFSQAYNQGVPHSKNMTVEKKKKRTFSFSIKIFLIFPSPPETLSPHPKKFLFWVHAWIFSLFLIVTGISN